MDIGLGNSLDKFARSINLKHPGGPKVEQLAKSSKSFIKLPYTVKGMDLFYSGLSTAATRMVTNKNENINDVCYSYQEVAFAMVVEVVERALSLTKKKEVLLVGGVGANLRLQEMLLKMCDERKCLFFVPKSLYLGDNGIMIANTGLSMYKHNIFLDIKSSVVDPTYRTDLVTIPWRNEYIKKNDNIINDGAEAKIYKVSINQKEYIIKDRIQKKYRINILDNYLRKTRTKNEVKIILEVRKIGIRTPII